VESRNERILNPQSLGEALHLLVRRARIPAQALADATGVSRTTIMNYLNDHATPNGDRMTKLVMPLAEALGENPDELIEEMVRLKIMRELDDWRETATS
jgi:transcriptional regulator with XRE-family HTH domain